jgi:hypothetical protein
MPALFLPEGGLQEGLAEVSGRRTGPTAVREATR